MRTTYITGMGCISAQRTFDTSFLEGAAVNEGVNVLPAAPPAYKEFISPVALRRMANGVKNGIVASVLALREAGTDSVDAIVTGSGLGCIDDSEKFLKAILDTNEEYLTPLSFIQSSNNTVGTQLALRLGCTAYNFTFVNAAVSFESALLDAALLIDEREAATVLVGGVDETTDFALSLYKAAGFIKTHEPPYPVLHSVSKGVVYGEGAAFFVLDEKKSPGACAAIVDVDIVNRLDAGDIAGTIGAFIASNGLDVAEIDALVLGYNGDAEYDGYYATLSETLFAGTPQVYYKHLSGEYNTASAFGLWVGVNILKTQSIPGIISVNAVERREYRNILLYNHYKGRDQSMILIAKA